MRKIAVFASGTGSNFQAIVDEVERGELPVQIALLVCDKPKAKAIDRADSHGIETFVFQPKLYNDKVSYEREILQKLREKEISFIVLAGYMRLIGKTLLHEFEGKIINIHPSLLPAFPGKDAIGQAFAAKEKETGVTVHYVDEGMDTGPIIAQQAVPIIKEDTIETLTKKIQTVEHQLYPQTLKSIVKNFE